MNDMIEFTLTPLETAREELKRLVENVTLDALPEIDKQLRIIGYYLRYGLARRPYTPRIPPPIADLRCHMCNKGPRDGIGVYRVGEKWLCNKHLPKGTGFVIGEPSSMRNERMKEEKKDA